MIKPISLSLISRRTELATEAVQELDGVCRTLMDDIEALTQALEPFGHPDLCKLVGGNIQGDESIVFGKNDARLTIGDFRRARKVLKGEKE